MAAEDEGSDEPRDTPGGDGGNLADDGDGGAATENTLGFRGVKFREPDPGDNYTVFISSPGDVAKMRRRVRDLIHESINPPLGDRSRAQLQPRMWERATAQVAPGGDVNDIFASRVVTSHAALVLLKTRLGTGMQEEVEAVLALPEDRLPDEQVWLSVLRFDLEEGEEPNEDPAPLDEFLSRVGEDRRVFYNETGGFDSEEAWQTVVKTLTAYALAALDKSREKERNDVR